MGFGDSNTRVNYPHSMEPKVVSRQGICSGSPGNVSKCGFRIILSVSKLLISSQFTAYSQCLERPHAQESISIDVSNGVVVHLSAPTSQKRQRGDVRQKSTYDISACLRWRTTSRVSWGFPIITYASLKLENWRQPPSASRNATT